MARFYRRSADSKHLSGRRYFTLINGEDGLRDIEI